MTDQFSDDLLSLDERTAAEQLVVEVDGFEGPLDLLLELARGHKVDLRVISILHLAEQYLAFIAEAHRLRLELAADYLVMAAWLAYLKSRLLLPEPEEGDGPSGEELAAHLAFQLRRLEALRKVASKLMNRDRLGRDVFARGSPEPTRISKQTIWQASVIDLVKAYAYHQSKSAYEPLHMTHRPVYAMKEALRRLSGVIIGVKDWARLESFLPKEWRDALHTRSALASTFAASLELAKEGRLELQQHETFGPIYMREGGGEKDR